MQFKTKRSQIRLLTDHHHLQLSLFDSRTSQWQVLGEKQFEHLHEIDLLTWLKTFPEIGKADICLIISESLFQFQQLPLGSYLKIDSASLAFIKEVRREVLTPETAEQYWSDALLQESECQVALLPKASIECYLQVFKKIHARLMRISPANSSAFNLLNWREQKARMQKIARFLRLGLLPSLVLLLVIIWQENADTKQASFNKQNQQLTEQLSRLSQNQASLLVQQNLPLLQKLMAETLIHSFSIQGSGEISLSGTAPDHNALDTLLRQFNGFTEFKPHSMHAWQVQEGAAGQNWQVQFKLQENSL